jgi:putative restriction endonuclease
LYWSTRSTGSGLPGQGAESIVLSGRYEDDEDLGSTILYTGHGGRNSRTDEQIDHQDDGATDDWILR